MVAKGGRARPHFGRAAKETPNEREDWPRAGGGYGPPGEDNSVGVTEIVPSREFHPTHPAFPLDLR